jgi:hypothetical protein
MKTFPTAPLAAAAVLCCSPLLAQAEVLLDQAFASGLGAFSASGSVSSGSYGARLRGGSGPGQLASPTLSTSGYNNLRLTVSRETSGLDAGETAVLTATVNGQARTLEATRTASGAITFNLGEGVSSLRLQFAVNASSSLETYTIASVKLEGDKAGECGAACNPPPAARTIVPDASWSCGLPGGIPDPSGGSLVFSTVLAADAALQVGNTPYGLRRVTPTRGGSIASGGRLNGAVQSGALDFDLTLPSGAIEHESRYTLRTSDGTLIYMRNCGVADGSTVRFVADFEAPSSSTWQWLNSGTYVGVRTVTSQGIGLSVYAVSATPNPAHAVLRVPADNSVRQQAWNCTGAAASATQGSEVMQARVNIGSSIAVGNSKRGRRNIIPITGGSVTGTAVAGTVNPGGADYQLTVDGELQIEARYTIKANNGETVVVRNCGNFANSDLTQVMFEAKSGGAYSGLNDKRFVGTITPGIGRVTIKAFDER